MNALVFGTLCVLSIAMLVLILQYRKLSKAHRALRQELVGLEEAEAQVPSEFIQDTPKRSLKIRILNPVEVAAQQSWFVSKFGNLAAPAVQSLVYKQAVPIVVEEMKKHGVEAEVTVSDN